MPSQTIALVGVGGLGKYICEELLADESFDVIVISRADHPWATARQVPVHQSDYSFDSILSILNSVHATTLISFINEFTTHWITLHCSFLLACQKSVACKRFIPSEWIGDTGELAVMPGYYATTRAPFREMLRNPAYSKGVDWTLFNGGWFMDYLLPPEKTYLSVHPWDFRVILWGGGEIGRAVVELLKAKNWDSSTYVSGEWATLNEVIKILESFEGCSFEKSYKSAEDIQETIARATRDGDTDARLAAQTDEYAISESAACPLKETLRQRKIYFSNIKFSTIKEVLEQARTTEYI